MMACVLMPFLPRPLAWFLVFFGKLGLHYSVVAPCQRRPLVAGLYPLHSSEAVYYLVLPIGGGVIPTLAVGGVIPTFAGGGVIPTLLGGGIMPTAVF